MAKFVFIFRGGGVATPGLSPTEMQAHLGDAFRRLGRKEEARAALSRAEALSKDAGITAYIRDQQALLGAPTPR